MDAFPRYPLLMLRPTCRAILWAAPGEDLVRSLQAAGCEVEVAADEGTALELKASHRPEVIFLYHCPSGGCGRLRRAPPHLDALYCALIPKHELPHTDLSGGYDDFLTLPLHPEEVAARAKLWRWRREQISAEGALRAGPLLIDLTNLRVTLDGAPVELTYKEYELLCLLLRRRGQVLTRESVLDRVWGADYYGGNRTVDVHIRRLRMKMPEIADRITTVHGVGYRFAG